MGILLLTPCFIAHTQEDFLVLISSGQNYKRTEKGFFELKNGASLTPKDQIELLPNGLIVLMDQEGRLLQLTREGKYNLATLDLSGLSLPSELIFNEWTTFYKRIRARSEPVQNGFLIPDGYVPFQFDFPVSTEAYGRWVTLKWPQKTGPYIIELSNEYEAVFQSFETDSTGFKLDLLGKDLAFKDAFGIQVLDKGSKLQSGVFFLDKLSPPDKELLDQLLRKLPDGQGTIMQLTKAVIFENRGLFADAASLLRSLAEQNPTLFQGFYEGYLNRYDFSGLITSTRR